jgi:hypothetical protein
MEEEAVTSLTHGAFPGTGERAQNPPREYILTTSHYFIREHQKFAIQFIHLAFKMAQLRLAACFTVPLDPHTVPSHCRFNSISTFPRLCFPGPPKHFDLFDVFVTISPCTTDYSP